MEDGTREQPSIEKRVERARAAKQAYAETTGGDALAEDLIADLLHFVHQEYDVNVDYVLETAREYYEVETNA